MSNNEETKQELVPTVAAVNLPVGILTSLPALTSNIPIIAKRVKDDIDALQISTIEATEENKTLLKAVRTKLREEAAGFKSDVKGIKDILLRDFNVFDQAYKDQIVSIYNAADATLSAGIDTITAEQLNTSIQYAKDYFNKLYQAKPIEKFTFESMNLTINVSTSYKAIRDMIDKAFTDTEAALIVINTYGANSDRLYNIWQTNGRNITAAIVTLTNQLQAEAQLAKERAERNAEIERQNAIRAQAKLDEKPLDNPQTLASAEMSAKEAEPDIPQNWTIEEVLEFKLHIKATDSQFTALITYLVNEEIEYDIL